MLSLKRGVKLFLHHDMCCQCRNGIAANKINNNTIDIDTTFFLVFLDSPKHHGISNAFEHARTIALLLLLLPSSLRRPPPSENSLNRESFVLSPTPPFPLSSSNREINPSILVALIDRLCTWYTSLSLLSFSFLF